MIHVADLSYGYSLWCDPGEPSSPLIKGRLGRRMRPGEMASWPEAKRLLNDIRPVEEELGKQRHDWRDGVGRARWLAALNAKLAFEMEPRDG